MSRKNKNKNNDKDCFLSKKERNALRSLVGNVDWCDEDSVFGLGVELGKWSVKLRAEVLRRGELRSIGEDV